MEPLMLNIPDLDCVIASENHDSYIIDAKSSWHDARPICETCHSANTIRFGTRKRKFQDLPMHGKKVTINYHLRRFKCQFRRAKYFSAAHILRPSSSLIQPHSEDPTTKPGSSPQHISPFAAGVSFSKIIAEWVELLSNPNSFIVVSVETNA